MPYLKSDLPRSFPPGSELTNKLVDAIIRELWRWRKVQSAPPISVSNAESDQPPIFSYESNVDITEAWGVTPTSGYASGTIANPASNATSVTLYPIPGDTGTTMSVTPTYSVYGGTIVAGKNAYYKKFPNGKWYIITADC